MSAQTLTNIDNELLSSEILVGELLNEVDNFVIKNISRNLEATPSTVNSAEYAAKYHLTTPGHKVRARLCIAACLELKVNHNDMLILSAVSELLHNASLIHDDIQDKDETRRGVETVWKKFGINIAICAGDLLLSTAYGVLANISEPKLLHKLIKTINERTAAVIKGQCEDIEYKNKPINSVGIYARIAKAKSGALLGLPIELALILAEKDEHLNLAKNAAAAFAVGYQVADDLIDIEKDASANSSTKSLNIVFVLSDAGSKSPINDAIALAEQYLSEAVRLAEKLPNSLGADIIRLVHQLQGQIKHESKS
jgi:geranylgeranyl diphosphate synthase type II